MFNGGINEQLLEDIRDLVKASSEDTRWRISSLEKPDKNIYPLITGCWIDDITQTYTIEYSETAKSWLIANSPVKVISIESHFKYWRPCVKVDLPNEAEVMKYYQKNDEESIKI